MNQKYMLDLLIDRNSKPKSTKKTKKGDKK